MDYAFCRLTRHRDDMAYTEKDTIWLPLDKIISISPADSGALVTYFDGSTQNLIASKETAEGIFNSVVFVKSPTAYYVDPKDPTVSSTN